MNGIRIDVDSKSTGAPMGIRLAIDSSKRAVSLFKELTLSATVQVSIFKEDGAQKTAFRIVGDAECEEESVLVLESDNLHIADLEPATSTDLVSITLTVGGFSDDKDIESFLDSRLGEKTMHDAVELLRIARGLKSSSLIPHSVGIGKVNV